MKLGFFWPFLATYIFYVDLGDLKMILAGFWAHGRFLDTVSGHRITNFHWKLCTRIYNFLFWHYMLINITVFLVRNCPE